MTRAAGLLFALALLLGAALRTAAAADDATVTTAAADASAGAAAEGAAAAAPAGRPVTLDEAVAMALEKNEGIVVERLALSAAQAAVGGARGAYDPVLEVAGDLQRTREPVNSAFSGSPAGAAAPTIEAAGAGASVRQLLPTGGSVTVSVSGSRATTDGAFTLLSPAYGTQAGIELRQPLLRDRATDPARSAIKVAASDRRRAAASLRREINDTVAAVEDAYWTLVAARREVGVREEAVRLAAEQLEETRGRIEAGAAPATEIAQPRAELERRRGELFASHEAAARADSALKLLILGDDDAAPWSTSLAPADDPAIEVVAVDVERALERALASRPELHEAEAVRERRGVETALARDAVRPALDAVASFDRFGLAGSGNPAGTTLPGLPAEIPAGMEGPLGRSFGMLDEDRYEDARVGLELRIPIGNRAARAGVAIARSGERRADADLGRARKGVRAEVLVATAALETAGQRIEAARTARESAEVQLDTERERYAAGLSTNFLVLTRQNDLAGARLAEIEALTDYRAARVDLARATGTLLEERGIEVNEAPEG